MGVLKDCIACAVFTNDDVDTRQEVDVQRGERSEAFELELRDHAASR